MGGILGACVKLPAPPMPSDRPFGPGRPRRSFKGRVRSGHHTAKKPSQNWWTTSSNDMDTHHNHISFQNIPSAQKPDTTTTTAGTAYPNHGLALWKEQRCAWVGTQPRAPPRQEPREPAVRKLHIFIYFSVVNFCASLMCFCFSDFDVDLCAAGILAGIRGATCYKQTVYAARPFRGNGGLPR